MDCSAIESNWLVCTEDCKNIRLLPHHRREKFGYDGVKNIIESKSSREIQSHVLRRIPVSLILDTNYEVESEKLVTITECS
ncbi:hypothetical protein NPIL_309481 [Nephila pilipes]|uniref:Uncharacterized protein n=1 Tax=Nephila pilipes TaxID=299642 RepID=A0A8X6QA78_NEPPI|nr:hypothetical protein NPIL_309481 [Nephila pilipes]